MVVLVLILVCRVVLVCRVLVLVCRVLGGWWCIESGVMVVVMW
jgi:hypothetical protein